MLRRTLAHLPLAACAALVLAACDNTTSVEPPVDASSTPDTGATDSGAIDGGAIDAGSPDASAEAGDDASTPEAGDASAADATDAAEVAVDAGPTPSCEAYCTAVMANCTGAKNAQYIDKARCLSMCARLVVGTLADTTTDTLGCRQVQALAAKDSPDLSCPKAGATGGGACGASRCDAFCKLAAAQCPTGAPFASEGDCKAKCPEASFDPAAGEIDMMGKTLNCMQYHLQAAYLGSSGAVVHCPHLTIASGPCGP